MFSLIFSPLGSIKRGQFFTGLIITIMLIITLVVIGSVTMMINLAQKTENAVNKQQMAQLNLQRAQAEAILASPNPSPEDLAKAKEINNNIQAQEQSMPLFKDSNKYLSSFGYGGIAIGLLFLWCNFCLLIKRLRDTGFSAWLIVVPTGIVVCMFLPFPQATTVANYGLFVIAAYYLFCMFYPSKRSD